MYAYAVKGIYNGMLHLIFLFVAGHQGIHRLLYAYFMGLPRDQAPYVSIPLNTVIQLTPNTYGCDEKRYLLLSKEEMMKVRYTHAVCKPALRRFFAFILNSALSRLFTHPGRAG